MLHALMRLSVCRLHTSSHLYGVDKATLSKLRKKTGISFINCKKALEKFNNDFKQAEKWLKDQAQKEGWTKASKLESRPMSSGLVGLKVDNESAVMVEVNCETDFVAKNDKFRHLVSTVTNACLSYGKHVGQPKLVLDTEAVKSVPGEGVQPLSDVLAVEIGNIGENMRIRRAVYLQLVDHLKLGSYVHTADVRVHDGKIKFGKYGALVVFDQQRAASGEQLSVDILGAQLAQHIVGMNPLTLGTMEEEEDPEQSNKQAGDPESQTGDPESQTDDPESQADDPEEQTDDPESQTGDPESQEPDPDSETKENPDEGSGDEVDESRLFQQEFLLDPDLTVRDLLNMNSAVVEDFVRFECGEVIKEDNE